MKAMLMKGGWLFGGREMDCSDGIDTEQKKLFVHQQVTTFPASDTCMLKF